MSDNWYDKIDKKKTFSTSGTMAEEDAWRGRVLDFWNEGGYNDNGFLRVRHVKNSVKKRAESSQTTRQDGTVSKHTHLFLLLLLLLSLVGSIRE